MKRSTLLYLSLTVALFAGLAQLRADWLGGASGRTEPAAVVSSDRVVTSAMQALHGSQGRETMWVFVRQP